MGDLEGERVEDLGLEWDFLGESEERGDGLVLFSFMSESTAFLEEDFEKKFGRTMDDYVARQQEVPVAKVVFVGGVLPAVLTRKTVDRTKGD